MGENTRISWADDTFNPWWGCVKVSDACKFCYAATHDARFAGDDPHWGPRASRRFFGAKHWNNPRRWDRRAERDGARRRVFCASMADVFEVLPVGHPDIGLMNEARKTLWQLIEQTSNLDWLLLTKRPENIRQLLPQRWLTHPQPNVWLGTTVEHQDVDHRVRDLLNVPAFVHFVSYEPALGPLDLTSVPRRGMARTIVDGPDLRYNALRGFTVADVAPQWSRRRLDWVIAGDESGLGRRPSSEDWYRKVRDDCAANGVAFFYKQKVIGLGFKVETPLLDGRRWTEFPTKETDR